MPALAGRNDTFRGFIVTWLLLCGVTVPISNITKTIAAKHQLHFAIFILALQQKYQGGFFEM